jgi:AcrR family transcriptional regulator
MSTLVKSSSRLKAVTGLSVRARRTLETRRRMVHAAYQQFCREGYAGTTMNAIAEEADVAVQTLYYTFHNKAALLGDALGGAIIGFDQWREPPPDPDITELLPWHGWWSEFQAAGTSGEALDVFVANGVDILERVGPLVAALHGAAGDPEAAEVVRLSEERRVAAYGEAVRAVARKPPGLRRGLGQKAATDIVVAVFSAEMYEALSTGRGWPRSRCTRFFSELLAFELLGVHATAAPTLR